MTVMKPSGVFKMPPISRGASPNRTGDNRNGTVARNYEGKMRKTPRQSPDRGGKAKLNPIVTTPDRSLVTRRSSPNRSLVRSRDSDTGSIERLDDMGYLRSVITNFNQSEDNINVAVRVRPLNHKEQKVSNNEVVQFPGNGQILCNGTSSGSTNGLKSRLFSFNVVFEPAATQMDVLEFSGVKRLIEMAIEGFSSTCFCYGQTGSGKTHTLTGPPGLIDKKNGDSADNGLVIRSFNYLFKLLQEQRDTHFVLKASFLEIYNEKVIDLLNPGSARKPLAVRWSKKVRSFFVENLFTVDCEELDDLIAVLEEGMRNRSVGSHNMNDYSSRSHTILTVHIRSEQPAEGGVFITKQGKINFVDLAGSEMTKKTQSEGKTLEEANNINKSLMVLGYCISSLSDNKKRSGHIPYRDSKLTKLLADSLAGNGVTLMIACVSPARSNISETVNTLRYAARAKKIRTKPVVVMDPREALILSLKRELDVMKTENDQLRSVLRGGVASPLSDSSGVERQIPQVNLEELAELGGPQLAELVRLYMTENEALRKENAELFTTREIVVRDQELVCRENERLLKKLEDVNSVCCRSPIIPARPTYSAELLNQTTGDLDDTLNSTWNENNERIVNFSDNGDEIPETIRKELDKRQLGPGLNGVDFHRNKLNRRNDSWNSNTSASELHRKTDLSDIISDRRVRVPTVGQTAQGPSNTATQSRRSPPNRRFSLSLQSQHQMIQADVDNHLPTTITQSHHFPLAEHQNGHKPTIQTNNLHLSQRSNVFGSLVSLENDIDDDDDDLVYMPYSPHHSNSIKL